MIVVDASVAVKWFLPEQGADAAAALFDADDFDLVGPDMLAVEVCATLVRGANIDKSNRKYAEISLEKFGAMLSAGEISLLRTAFEQLHHATLLAMDIGHPLKDCIYLALAMELGCQLVTADARFAERAKGVYADVRLLSEPM